MPAMASPRAVFRFIYGASYTLLCVLLAALLLITPGDVIYRALVADQKANVWAIAVCYVVTLLLVSFIYATRLYINKSALASIPIQWIPIEKGDVHPTVYKLIAYGLSRSAAISYEARPRVGRRDGEDAHVVRTEEGADTGRQEREVSEKRSSQLLELRRTVTPEGDMGVVLPPHRPVWGEIEHWGWGSPDSPDLVDVQYSTVFSELPNLIEAKAFTLAPSDPESRTEPPILEPDAVALLQRPVSMSLRDYIGYLGSLGVLGMTPVVSDFLAKYEQARFSPRPISNAKFRELMKLFAEVLRGMGPLGTAVSDSLAGRSTTTPSVFESDIDNDAPRSNLSRSATASSQGSGNRRHVSSRPSTAAATTDWHPYRTAPTTPKSRKTEAPSHSSSVDSFAQTRHPYPVSQPSSGSLRSKRSEGDGSVIHFAMHGQSTTPL